MRVVEKWGDRLRGKTLLVGTDNTVAHATAAKFRGRSAEMQELLRRLLELCELYQIELRPVHTPGARLIRPDQLSRGYAAAEPRQRFRAPWFAAISAWAGGFTEFLGSERALAAPPSLQAVPTAFLHPSFGTVGSALRLASERMRSTSGAAARGVVVVPLATGAKWWSMVRHFRVAGVVSVGAPCLEEDRMGGYAALASRRTAIILVFPRISGPVCVPLRAGLSPNGTYHPKLMALQKQELRPLLPGSFLWEPSKDGAPSRLLRVDSRFSPWDKDSTKHPQCEVMVRVRGGSRDSSRWERSGKHDEVLVDRAWMVDPLVERIWGDFDDVGAIFKDVTASTEAARIQEAYGRRFLGMDDLSPDAWALPWPSTWGSGRMPKERATLEPAATLPSFRPKRKEAESEPAQPESRKAEPGPSRKGKKTFHYGSGKEATGAGHGGALVRAVVSAGSANPARAAGVTTSSTGQKYSGPTAQEQGYSEICGCGGCQRIVSGGNTRCEDCARLRTGRRVSVRLRWMRGVTPAVDRGSLLAGGLRMLQLQPPSQR